ncbi:MAG: HEAT repeat domain-containing protein [Myxococcota bacterium]
MKWRVWASTASTVENGWQSDFPDWSKLIDAACEVMKKGLVDSKTLNLLEEAWAISEEGEELSDFASEHIEESWAALQALANSPLPACRWQVYHAAAAAGAKAEELLRSGLSDVDGYCRRRAFLALAQLGPKDAKSLAEQAMGDSDPYMRSASIKMAASTGEEEYIDAVRRRLRSDREEMVRNAAHR